jgi:hypothetical protein
MTTKHDDNCIVPACPFKPCDIANLLSLAQRRDDIIDSVNTAKKSVLLPPWAIGVVILLFSALFSMGIWNRSGISTMNVTLNQTDSNVAKLVRVMEKHVGPILPSEKATALPSE